MNMKKRILKITAIVIAVVGSFYSCKESDILDGAVPFEYGAATRSGGMFFRYVDGERLYFNISSNKFIVKIDENMAESAIESSFRSDAALQGADISVMSGNEFRLIRFCEGSRGSISELTTELMSSDAISFVGYVIVDEAGRKTSALTNQVNVRLKNDSDFPILQRALASFDLISKVRQDEFDSRIYLLTVNCVSGRSTLQIANELHQTGLFEFATPDLIFFIRYATNDTHFSQQWGLRNIEHVGIDVRAQQAWTITTGSPTIRIAILDSGVDLNHPDLRGNLLQGFNAVTGTAGPGAGAPPAVDVRNRSHGTTVAGIAAAQGNNGIGIAGVAHTSRILPISMGDFPRAYRITRGINWARTNGARVINMSFNLDSTPDVISALNAATAANIVLVASSGNGYRGVGRPFVTFPAGRPDVIAVGSITNRGNRAGSSDHGYGLDIVAPGVDIFTTGMLVDLAIPQERIVNNGSNGVYFRHISGTSLAAPHVAGVAALMLSVNPNLTVQQVRNIIESTANRNLQIFTAHYENRPNGRWNREVGHGLVDAYAAVRLASSTRTVTISGPAAVCPGAPNTIFTVQNVPPGKMVRWLVDPPLYTVNSNQNSVTVRHSGMTVSATSRVGVEILMNEQAISGVRREVVANRPTITSIVTPPGIQTNTTLTFTVNHNNPSAAVWSVTPSHGVSILSNSNNALMVVFGVSGNYTVTASVTNACGTATMSRNIVVGNNIVLPPLPLPCPFCGSFTPNCPRCDIPPILLSDPEEEKEE